MSEVLRHYYFCVTELILIFYGHVFIKFNNFFFQTKATYLSKVIK